MIFQVLYVAFPIQSCSLSKFSDRLLRCQLPTHYITRTPSRFSSQMLFLITQPFQLQPGNYQCRQISESEASKLIKSSESGLLTSFVGFKSTQKEIERISTTRIELVRKFTFPNLQDGDQLLEIRLSDQAFEYFLTDYSPN